MTKIYVYWYGIIGIPGKGPHWTGKYDPNMTIGQMIQKMHQDGCVERNKRVEIFKFEKGNMSKWDKQNPYWSHDTKLSDYVSIMGCVEGKDFQMVCVFI